MQTAGVSIYLYMYVVLFSEAVFKYIETRRECKRKQPLSVDIDRHTSTLFYVYSVLKRNTASTIRTYSGIYMYNVTHTAHTHTHMHTNNVYIQYIV